jgi:hypothetical protein
MTYFMGLQKTRFAVILGTRNDVFSEKEQAGHESKKD